MPDVLRVIPLGSGACPVCDEVVPLAQSKAKVGQPTPLRFHGPRRSPCAGSGQPAKPWHLAVGLPAWDDMSDLDKGAALMFVWKAHWERDYAYAREHYPVRFVDDPRLVRLGPVEACRHASLVTGGHTRALDRLGVDEHQRLYSLAHAHESAGAEA